MLGKRRRALHGLQRLPVELLESGRFQQLHLAPQPAVALDLELNDGLALLQHHRQAPGETLQPGPPAGGSPGARGRSIRSLVPSPDRPRWAGRAGASRRRPRPHRDASSLVIPGAAPAPRPSRPSIGPRAAATVA